MRWVEYWGIYTMELGDVKLHGIYIYRKAYKPCVRSTSLQAYARAYICTATKIQLIFHYANSQATQLTFPTGTACRGACINTSEKYAAKLTHNAYVCWILYT